MVVITELYRLLFGKSHLRDGDVISMSEHGRAGGVSTGQGYKNVGFVDENINMQTDSGDSNITYVGFAKFGTATSDAAWKIYRLSTSSGTVIEYADGDSKYNNIFDDRESLSYS